MRKVVTKNSNPIVGRLLRSLFPQQTQVKQVFKLILKQTISLIEMRETAGKSRQSSGSQLLNIQTIDTSLQQFEASHEKMYYHEGKSFKKIYEKKMLFCLPRQKNTYFLWNILDIFCLNSLNKQNILMNTIKIETDQGYIKFSSYSLKHNFERYLKNFPTS